MDAHKTLNTVARGAIIIFIGAILGKLFSFAYRVIVSRLGDYAYGELSIALALFGILNVIALIGLETGITKFVSEYLLTKNIQKIKGAIISSNLIVLITSLTLAILTYLNAQWIATTLFNSTTLTPLIKIFAITLPFESLRAIIIAIFNAHQVVKYDVYWRVLFENGIKIIAAIILISLGYGIIGAAYAYFISILISYLIFIIVLIKKLPYITNSTIIPLYENKELYLYSIPLVLNALAIFLLGWMDSLMIGYYQNPSAVGLYNVAVPASRLLLLIPAALTTIYIPVIISVKNHHEAFKNIYTRTTKWILASTLLIGIWLIMYSKEVITLFFTSTYLGATNALIILTIGFFFYGLSFPTRDILLSHNRSGLISISVIIGAALNIILNAILIPKYGINGAAIASAAIYCAIALLYYYCTYYQTKTHSFNKQSITLVLAILASAIVTYIFTKLITYTTHIGTLATLLISGILITILSGLTLIITRHFDNEDKKIITSILNKLKSYIPKIL